MKNFLLIPKIALVIFISIEANAQSKKMTTTLKGTLENQQRDFFMLQQQGRSDTIKFGKDGKFEVMIEQNSANYFTLEHGKQMVTLYLLPTDIVTITLNATNLIDAKEVTGNSASYCNYLLGRQKSDKAIQLKYNTINTASMKGDTYYALRDSMRNAQKSILEKEALAKHFIEPFMASEKKSLDYQMGYELITYKTNATKMGNTAFPLSIDKFTQSLDLNDEQMSFNQFFQSFALNYISQKASEQYYLGTDKSVLRYYELVIELMCSNINSDKNKSVLISEFMPQLMNDVGTSDLRQIVNRLESCCNDKILIESVKRVAAQYEYLYPGKPAPDASFYDAQGNKSKISDFKGQILYIDTWATWCGPCKREIPFLKTLEEEFHGKNVKFISVSTDKDVTAWKNFIAKEAMGGLQLHQSDNFDETISKMYIVNSIPRFILIDQAGNIVNTDAPRPSSGAEIRELFNTLLAN